MAIFTRYAAVVDATGQDALSVREALALINQTLDEVLAEREGRLERDARFAVAWFEELGFGTGEFGRADVLAHAKNTSVQGMVEAGILESHTATCVCSRRWNSPPTGTPPAIAAPTSGR